MFNLNERKNELEKISSSKSKNTKIIFVHFYILNYQNEDSDFWYMGNGTDEVASMFEQFDPETWFELENDIKYWALEQIEILIDCLVNGGMKNENNQKAIPQRSRLLTNMFSIFSDEGIKETIIDNIDFINLGEAKSKVKLLQIKKWIELKNLKFAKQSIEKAIKKARDENI